MFLVQIGVNFVPLHFCIYPPVALLYLPRLVWKELHRTSNANYPIDGNMIYEAVFLKGTCRYL